MLVTRDELGYVLTDVSADYAPDVVQALADCRRRCASGSCRDPGGRPPRASSATSTSSPTRASPRRTRRTGPAGSAAARGASCGPARPAEVVGRARGLRPARRAGRRPGRQHRPGRRRRAGRRRGAADDLSAARPRPGRRGRRSGHRRRRRDRCRTATVGPTARASTSASTSRRATRPRSAGWSRPTPAASGCCATAARGSRSSASRRCSPTARSSAAWTRCPRTTPATTWPACCAAARARSPSSPPSGCGCGRSSTERSVALLGPRLHRRRRSPRSPRSRPRLTTLEAAELFFADGLALVRDHTGLPAPIAGEHPAYLLVECADRADPSDELLAALEAVSELVPGIDDIVVGEDGPARERLWRYREAHTESINAAGVPVKLDVAVPRDSPRPPRSRSCPDVVAGRAPTPARSSSGTSTRATCTSTCLGRTSSRPPRRSPTRCSPGHVASAGASARSTASAGPRRPGCTCRAPSAEIAAMRAIKTALDPDGRLNPGVIFPA